MEFLNWELSVLCKCINYDNLSLAALNIGISQPQLSRIISKLEDTFELELLNRTSKRKASWTQQAYKLAQIYSKIFNQFKFEINKLNKNIGPNQIKIGILEGVITTVLQICHNLLSLTQIKLLEIDVFDTNQLEEMFLNKKLDVIFTFRYPSSKKFKFNKCLGYQILENIKKKNSNVQVYSNFEFNQISSKNIAKNDLKFIISNSLSIRKEWLNKYGGEGILPSELKPHKLNVQNEVPLFIIAQDDFPLYLWNIITTYKSN